MILLGRIAEGHRKEGKKRSKTFKQTKKTSISVL
jgi:hypothetical protein